MKKPYTKLRPFFASYSSTTMHRNQGNRASTHKQTNRVDNSAPFHLLRSQQGFAIDNGVVENLTRIQAHGLLSNCVGFAVVTRQLQQFDLLQGLKSGDRTGQEVNGGVVTRSIGVW